ncbi:MAG: metal ABC transporter solute-binding protein, Zn/Mn family [Chlamydiia bacterium]
MKILWALPVVFLLMFRPEKGVPTRLDQWMKADSEQLHVLATTKMTASLIEKVGGAYVDVYTLINEDLDPHSYQLVKGDAEKFRRADLIFANGLQLEHGRSLQKLLKQEKTVFLGDKVLEKAPELFLPMDQGVDPHFWMDVALFSQTVPYIVAALEKVDPAHSADYRANGERLSLSLETLDRKIQAKMGAIPDNQRYLVSSHDAFQYFARRYFSSNWEDRFLAPEGISPDGQIGPLDIDKIIRHVVKYHVPVVFAESNISKDSLNKIIEACHQQGVFLKLSSEELFADSMGVDTYEEMMEHNARVICQELS